MSRGHCDCKYDCTGETPRDEFGEFFDEKDSFDLVRRIGAGEVDVREYNNGWTDGLSHKLPS